MISVTRKDRHRNSAIRKQTKVDDVVVKIRELKWRWAGHTLRGNDKWSKTVTTWYPRNGKRKRGRPFMRWDDELTQHAGKLWTRVAKD